VKASQLLGASHPTPAPVIELKGLHKSFGEERVLAGLNLQVFPQETVVIIGRSGIGKSVTLRHIVGLVQPDQGEVIVFGRDLAKMSPRELRGFRLKIGYLFQSGALINWIPIRENVALPLREHQPHLPNADVQGRVLEKLRLVGMEDAADKYPAEISGGMKKRAGLARAIILDPEVILYDEPTSGLDPITARAFDGLLRVLCDDLGLTVIVVTHDLDTLLGIVDRVIVLAHGKVAAYAPVQEAMKLDDPWVQSYFSVRRMINDEGEVTDGI
jgi:phospholipid/cholesterol/gamma-HCH transport system ATP-binding protein